MYEKVTEEQLDSFLADYYQKQKYPYERLGQAFMNHCLTNLEYNNPELFYSTSPEKTIKIITDLHLK